MGRTTGSVRALGYGELDRVVVTEGLLRLARRVGVDRVTMRGLAEELGASAPAVYYHVKDKSAALDLLTEACLARIDIPLEGTWSERLTAIYRSARAILLEVRGVAGLLQTRPPPPGAIAVDKAAQSILAEAGVATEYLFAAHTVMYTHLLGSVSLQHALTGDDARRYAAEADSRFAYGLRVIMSGIRMESL